jgi:hypothetical protein
VRERIYAAIIADCGRVDTDRGYDEMLDECYSFESVGGIFAHMSPSRVLAEMDPTAYQCGKNDWLDGEGDRLVEIGGEYYDREEAEEILEQVRDEIRAELDEIQDDEHDEQDEREDKAAARELKQEQLDAAEDFSL